MTVSILSLKVTSENDGAELICRSANPWFSGGALEDKRIISVACKCTRSSVYLWSYTYSKNIILFHKIYYLMSCLRTRKGAVEFIEFNVTSRFA